MPVAFAAAADVGAADDAVPAAPSENPPLPPAALLVAGEMRERENAGEREKKQAPREGRKDNASGPRGE